MLDGMPILARDFLNYIETIKGKSKGTAKEYCYDLRVFFRFMKLHRKLVSPFDTDFEQINISDIDEEFVRQITLSDLYEYMSFTSRERNNSSSSRARKVACMRSFFNYLFSKKHVIGTNPAAELETPKILKRLPKYLNIEESKQLLNSIDGDYRERDYAIITLFLNCGLRLSELVGINIDKIKNDTLTVLGKGGKERVIYLNSACRKALDEYTKVRDTGGVRDKNALFLSKRRQRISNKTVQYIVKKYIKLCGLDPERYSTHKLRHTAATLMYKYGGVDIRLLQGILGHESIATTEIYTHLDDRQIKNALDKNPLADISPNKK